MTCSRIKDADKRIRVYFIYVFMFLVSPVFCGLRFRKNTSSLNSNIFEMHI